MKTGTMKFIFPILLFCLGSQQLAPAQTQSSDTTAATGQSLLRNGNFEKGTEGWEPIWAREPSAVRAVLDTAERHGGAQSLRIEHTGEKDWSLANSLNLKVQPGEIYELTAWVRLDGKGSAILGTVTRDAGGKVINWTFGAVSTLDTQGWRFQRSRFVIPPGVATICPRLIGNGQATVWCADFTLTRQGSLAALRSAALPTAVTIRNEAMEITLRTGDATFAVKDRQTNQTWVQRANDAFLIVLNAKAEGRKIDLKLLDPVSMRPLTAQASLDGDSPEMVVSIHGRGRDESPARMALPLRIRQGRVAHCTR